MLIIGTLNSDMLVFCGLLGSGVSFNNGGRKNPAVSSHCLLPLSQPFSGVCPESGRAVKK